MTKTIPVSAHTRRVPDKAHDPFASEMEAKRKRFASKWGVELIGANDDRLGAPIADPVPGGGRSLLDIAAQLMALAKSVRVR